MDFDSIFQSYYSQFRGDSDVPTSSDDEYTVGMRLANEAINRWANYDGTYWKELFTTNQIDGSGAQTISTGTTSYAAPDNFREAGGFVTVKSTDGTVRQRYPIIDVNEVQFKSDMATYCYFTGNPVDGYFMNINPAPTSEFNGLDIDYAYYKTPTEFTTGTDVTEMANAYFIVHRMLANQFRVSRNPYYSSALRDSEEALKLMQLDNNSGTWANPWTVPDNSGTQWGG